eukprot:826724-Pyramimonas_sp.AAC.1
MTATANTTPPSSTIGDVCVAAVAIQLPLNISPPKSIGPVQERCEALVARPCQVGYVTKGIFAALSDETAEAPKGDSGRGVSRGPV